VPTLTKYDKLYSRMKPEPFKICPSCKAIWPTLDDYLSDPELNVVGYQAVLDDLCGGLFIFNHVHDDCGTSMAIPVKEFVSLSELPILNRRIGCPEKCPGLCMHMDELGHCPVKCECTWVREVLQTIRSRLRMAASPQIAD